MPDRNYFAKLREFLVSGLRKERTRRHGPTAGRQREPRRVSAYTLESLEPRLLLSADLTGIVTAHTLLDPSVPTNAEQAIIRVINSGDAKTTQVSQVAVYASLDGTLDGTDMFLGTAAVPKTIKPGAFKDVSVALSIPGTLAAGAYNLLARVDATNVILENSETNNVVAGPSFGVVWQFGAVPGRTDNTTLTLKDADGTRVTFSLSGPGLGDVIKNGSNWDVAVTGTTASSAVTITTNSAGNGRVTLHDVHVFGPLAAFTAARTDLSGTLVIDGPVNIPGLLPGTITLGSIQGGTVAVSSVEALTILGSVTNAKIYVGTTLGQDGQPGGTGAAADTYGQGRIGLFTVTGSMTGTTLRVGIDPVDGIYGNGNDTIVGGSASSIGGIIIGGTLSADSRIIAGALPARALINDRLVNNLANDPRFSTDVTGPVLTAGLAQDTGNSSIDGITNTLTITGSLTDAGGIATFKAGFGATATVNVLVDRQANGSFTLTLARLEQINGGPLTDGIYVLKLQATDTKGNPAQTMVSFTLDTAAPMVTVDLAPGSDTTPVGDQQTTNAIVTLMGHTEANALVELLGLGLGLGLTTTADGTGTFSFSTVALTLGANPFTVRATDQAGNQHTTGVTITRLLADSDGDGTPDSQEGAGPNGGDANSDGIPDSQQSNVVSVLNSANQYVTLVAPAGAAFTGAQALGNPSPGDAPAEVTFPLGFVEFQLTGLVGGAATVDLLMPAGTAANTYWKYGATPDNTAPHWYEFLYDGTTGAEINGSSMTLHFQDGVRGDNDLTINGSIVDPSGPGFVVNHAPAGTDKTITINEDAPYTFTLSDFGFTDPLDSPANSLQAVKITALPGTGTLTFNGTPVNAGDSISIPPAGVTWTARESNRQWQSVASSADGTKLVAAVRFGQLYTSVDAGVTWTARESNRDWSGVASSADGTQLVAAALGGGRLYTSTDAGVTWTARSNDPGGAGWRAVASSADGMKLVAAAGGGQLFTSTDAGVTWTAHESNRNWQGVASSADGMKLVAAAYFGQLYTSADAGVTWTARESVRQWSSVASSADGTKLVAGVQGGQLYTSTDTGMTWTARESVRQWSSVASSADGTKLVAGEFSGSGRLYMSTDAGVTWTTSVLLGTWFAVATSADGTKLVAGDYGTNFGGQLYTSVPQLGLVFTPLANANGSPYTSFTFQVQDSGGTANAGVDLDPTPNTLTFSVTSVNDAPAGADQTITTRGNTAYTFALADFGFSDPNDSPANTFQAVKITTVPSAGMLTVGGAVVNAGDLVSPSSVPAGATWTVRENDRNWFAVASSADGTKLVAAVRFGQLYTSTDAGVTWTARESSRNWWSIASSSDGTKLVAADSGGQLYTSTDSGVTWTARESSRNWVAVASSADGTKLVAAAYNGQLYTSTDSGVSWTARESSRNWFAVASSADGTKLVVGDYGTQPSAGDQAGQLYTSTDAGVTWTAHSSLGHWASVASSADGTKLVAGTDYGQLYTSTDAGVTWTARESSRNWMSVASSADGTKLVAGDFGLFGGQLYTSTDAGVTWTAHDSNRRWKSVASSADGTKLVAAAIPFVGSLPGQLSTSTAQLGLVYTPSANANGSPYTSFTFQVQDSGGTANAGLDLDPTPNTITFNVTALNVAPVLTAIGNQTVNELQTLSFTATATDADLPANTLTFSLTNGTSGLVPAGASITAGGAFTWTPTEAQGPNVYTFDVVVTDNGSPNLSARETIAVTVYQNQPLANFTASPNPSAAGQTVSFDASISTAGRPDRSIVAYAWDFGDGTTASGVTATHAFALFGNYTVTLTVTDNNVPAKTATTSHVSNVSLGNQAPNANAGGPYLADLGSGLTLNGTGSTDPNLGQGDAIVSYQWLVNGSLALSGATPSLTATQITALGVGIFSVQLTVTDSLGATNSGTSTLTVNQGNQAPVNIVPGAQTTLEDTALVFNQANGNLISVSDVDTATVTVTLAVTNGALTLGGTTGLTGLTGNGTGLMSFGGSITDINSAMTGLSYLSILNFNGSDQLTLTTADGVAAPVLSIVALTVTPVNDAPAGADQTITTPGNTAYTFTLADTGFTDPNDSPADSFQALKITTLPGAGTLTVNGAPVNAGDLISPSATGATWTAHESNRNWQAIASSADGTKLVAAVWLGQLYTSTDSGVTWTARESDRQWQSVASSADGTKLVASAFIGQLYTSTDSGVTWTARESTRFWGSVASSADGMKLVAADEAGHLYTSTDAGVSWTARESERGWVGVASSADGTKLVASDFQGVGAGGLLYTSTDSGVTWTARASNQNWFSVASSADGTKLVAAVSGGQLYTSTDAGVTWTAREFTMGFRSVASSADGTKLVAAAGQLYTSTDSGVTWTVRENGDFGGYWSAVASSADGTKLAAGFFGGHLWTSAASLGLVFTPALNANGTPNTSFTFQVQDSGGTANTGVDLDPTPNTVTFNVTADNVAPVADAGGPYLADAGSGLTLDGTASSDPNAAAGDTIVSYQWLVNGSLVLSGATPTLSAAQIDSFGVGTPIAVQLTVTDSFGLSGTGSATLTVYNNSPTAAFTVSPNPAAPGQSLAFDASASTAGRPDRSIVSYAWDFGDGTTASGVTATHAFALFGNYTVTLTVTDNNVPTKTATTSHVISVSQGNVAPVANAGGPYLANLGSPFILNGTGSSDPNASAGDTIVSYQWLVNNSLALSGATPSLSAAQINALGVGSFSVKLTVTDSLGLTNITTSTLSIS